MWTFLIENFRSFRELQEIPITPITVFVGENSSGKTSALAGLHHCVRLQQPRVNAPNFNENPYNLGGFENIVHTQEGTSQENAQFMLGFRKYDNRSTIKSIKNRKPHSEYKHYFENRNGYPSIFRSEIRVNDKYITTFFDKNDNPEAFEIGSGEESISITVDKSKRLGAVLFTLLFGHKQLEFIKFDDDFINKLFEDTDVEKININAALNEIRKSIAEKKFQSSMSFSPIRSRPKRFYEYGVNSERSSGNNALNRIAQISNEDRKRLNTIKKQLKDFGIESQLFDDFDVKYLDKSNFTPFSVIVNSNGVKRNIIDIGYGVSQILPIAFLLALDHNRGVTLMQQPEIHLHPRAQAAFASFVGGISNNSRQPIVVETHSDYFMSRLRLDVRDNKIVKNTDVSISYFKKRGQSTIVSTYGLDKSGNISGDIAAYREFFMSEQRKIIGL